MMVEQFPELRLVRGFVRGGGHHWWCVAPNGQIIDPTAAQFGDSLTPADYEEFDESLTHTLPTGKCPNCADFLYYHASICSKACLREFLLDLGRDPASLDDAVERAVAAKQINPPEDDPAYPRFPA